MPAPMAAQLSGLAKSSLFGITLPKGVTRESLQTPVEALCKAISTAWAAWQSSATLVGVVIQGPTALGGKLVGPPLEPLIRANTPPAFKQFIEPVAGGLQAQFQVFAETVKVSGMPWYPAFAAFPGPVAPLMPNVPCPLLAITSGAGFLSRSALKHAMLTRLPLPRPPGAEQVCEAICAGIESAVQIWLASTMVTNVMGTGPVPTFAPPYVPVGPVVGGVGTQIPGGMV